MSNELLKSEPGFIIKIQEGKRGEFTITYKENIIFDKKKTDRFPKTGEIVKLVKGI